MSWRFLRAHACCFGSALARRRSVASPSALLAAAGLVLGTTAAAWAATTDIRTVRTQVFRVGSTQLQASQVVPPSGSPASGVASFSLVSGAGLHYEITHNVAGE